MKFIAENESQLVEKIYELLSKKLEAGFKVALIGDLGAGKTTLVGGLLRKMGIQEPVTSPTFTLRKIYAINGLPIQHIDLYRHDSSAKSPEFLEWLNEKEYLTFVEWPENLPDSISLYDVKIYLKPISQNQREVEVI